MDKMVVPSPIAEFFRLKNAQDDKGLVAMFNEDATVVDGGEGKTMQGSEAIEKWVAKSISGLDLHTDIRSAEEKDGEWVVDTRMTGNFKASPARFKYSIQLRDDKISKLQVDFLGSEK
jgi:hypothetical protein